MSERHIEVTDEKGTPRVHIAGELPNPVIDGVERERDVKVSGIMLKDSEGKEAGGFGTINGTRATLLALDYSHHEAAVLFAADTPEGHATQLTMNEKVGFSPETGLERNPTRIQLAVQTGIPMLVMKGKDGADRIRIALDEEDNPIIEVVTKDGDTINLVDQLAKNAMHTDADKPHR